MKKRLFLLVIILTIILSGCSSEKKESTKKSGELSDSKNNENELIGNIYYGTAPVEAEGGKNYEGMEIEECYLSFYPGGILEVENISIGSRIGLYYDTKGDKIEIWPSSMEGEIHVKMKE